MGRYRGVIKDERICEYCELNEVDNETHFILYCPLVYVPDLDLIGIENGALIEYLFHNVFAFSEYLAKARERRRKVTYAR